MQPAPSLPVIVARPNNTSSTTFSLPASDYSGKLALSLPADVWKMIWLFTRLESHHLVARSVCKRLKEIFSEESLVIETYRFRVNCLWDRSFPLWQVYVDRNLIPDAESEVITKLMSKQLLECRADYKAVTSFLADNASEFIKGDPTRHVAFDTEAALQSATIVHELEWEEFIRGNPKFAREFKQFLLDRLVKKEPKMMQWFDATNRQELVEVALNQALQGNHSLLRWLTFQGLTLPKLKAVCVAVNFTLTEEFLAKIFPPIHVLPLKLLAKITGEVPDPIPLNFVCKTFKAAVALDFRAAILQFNLGQRCYHVTLMQLAIDQAEKGQLQLLEWFINKQFSFKPLFQDDKTRAFTLLRLSVTQMLQGNVTFRDFLQRFGKEMAGEEYAASTHPFYCAYALAIQKQCQTGLIADEYLELNRLPPMMARFNTGNEAREFRIRMEKHPYLAWVEESLGCEGYFIMAGGADLHFKWLAVALYKQAKTLDLQEALEWLQGNSYFKQFKAECIPSLPIAQVPVLIEIND